MDKADLLFWTDILSDHAIFQINAFSPKEEKYIENAERFYYIFKKWNKMILSEESVDMNALESDTKKFVDFKKTIIYELLNHDILINFSPSFINHMVNEGDEFLSMFSKGVCPAKTENPPLYIKIWLADASGHAFTLASFLDLAEKPSIQRIELFKLMFDKLGKKATEMEMIKDNLKMTLQTSLLQEETIELLEEFIGCCTDIGKLLDNKKIMSIGTLSSDLTKHFIKEHQYCINKIKKCL